MLPYMHPVVGVQISRYDLNPCLLDRTLTISYFVI